MTRAEAERVKKGDYIEYPKDSDYVYQVIRVHDVPDVATGWPDAPYFEIVSSVYPDPTLVSYKECHLVHTKD